MARKISNITKGQIIYHADEVGGHLRNSGPTIINPDGLETWHLDDKTYNRYNGPCYIHRDGSLTTTEEMNRLFERLCFRPEFSINYGS